MSGPTHSCNGYTHTHCLCTFLQILLYIHVLVCLWTVIGGNPCKRKLHEVNIYSLVVNKWSCKGRTIWPVVSALTVILAINNVPLQGYTCTHLTFNSVVG